ISSIEKVIVDHGDIEIYDIFSKVGSMDNLSDNIVNTIMEFLDNGLSKVLEGNVSRVVQNNIEKLTNEEVLEMMQELIDTKLGLLTTIGAILGGIVGFGMAFFYMDAPAIFQVSSLAIHIPVYAFLGYITNVMAIYFIFKPYRPLFGIKRLQGIIPQQ